MIMTKQETESLLRYMMCMYPNDKMCKLSEQEFAERVQMWSVEFANDSCASVGAAFRLARLESPVWMPTLPEIKDAMRTISARIVRKSDEQEFKDSHCGKTPHEWESLVAWENSPEYETTILSLKDKLARIFGGQDESAANLQHD